MQHDLADGWTLSFGPHQPGPADPGLPERLGWPTIAARVPGNVESDLIAAGLLGALERGTAVHAALAYEGHEWWYRRTLAVSAIAAGERLDLVCDGIDCIATVYIDGREIGRADDMLIAWRFDLTALAVGAHELAIRIEPAVAAGRAEPPAAGTWAMALNAAGLRVRKAPYQYGWDILPRLVSAGLWRAVRLEAVPATRFRRCYHATIACDGAAGTARVALDWEFASPRPPLGLVVRLRLEQDGRTLYERAVPAFDTRGRIIADLAAVSPWWPRGYGEPALAGWTLALVDERGAILAEHAETVGIRTVALRRRDAAAPGEAGEFRFVVNGTAIQVRGTNWVPLDALPSRSAAKIADSVAMLAELECTMVRCWGGGWYEDDAFFDACDRAGILVWQDFAFACAVYPEDDAFRATVAREAEAVILRLRNHACLALWCGDNECDESARWAGLPVRPDAHRITRGTLADAVAAHDPYRAYVPSSPALSVAASADPRLAPEQHLWSRQDWDHASYRDCAAGFIGEIGFHGCPARESLEQMMAPGEVWPWRGSASWRVKAPEPVPGCADYSYRLPLMARQAGNLIDGEPSGLDDFVLASQAAQAEGLKRVIERARLRKPACAGLLWWNLRDGWPLISDAVVDWYGRRKLAYEFIRRAQLPLAALVEEPVDGWHRVVVANDTRREAAISVTVADLDTGEEALRAQTVVAAGANHDLGRIALSAEARCLEVRLTHAGGEQRSHALIGPRPVPLARYRGWLERLAVPAGVGPVTGRRLARRG